MLLAWFFVALPPNETLKQQVTRMNSDVSSLKEAGLKVTLPRLKILEYLEGSEKRHHSAEDVYKAMLAAGEEVGLATIYRVLTQFESAGLVVRHHFENDRSVFELGSDEGAHHHDHLVCEKCGRIQEFVNETIEEAQHQVAQSFEFEVTSHSLYIYGLCGSCRK